MGKSVPICTCGARTTRGTHSVTQIEKNTEVCFFTEDLKNYWDSQVQFQREVTSGDLNISTISIPFVMPHPCTYRPPPTITRESALEAVNPQLLAQVMPVARHIYTGPRQKQRAETLNLASEKSTVAENFYTHTHTHTPLID